MAIKGILFLGLVVMGVAYGQYWNGYYPHQHVHPSYRPHNPYQQHGSGYQQVPGVSVSEAEWVCKNPKTGDMMIITAEDGPAPNPGQGTWTQPQYPQTQPQYPQTQPQYPQTQPQYPQTQPTYPPNYQTTPRPGQGNVNSNGEGLIDIRFGEK